MNARRLSLAFFIVLAVLSAACGSDSTTAPDTTPDAVTDAATDTAMVTDTATDVVTDTATDVATDTAAVSDAVSDAVADTAPDIYVAPDLIRLATAGESAHRILVLPGASPSEHTAAQELQEHLLAATGATLPILDVPPTDDDPIIAVGSGAAAVLGLGPGDEDLGEQGFVLQTRRPHVAIAGTPAAGTLYGVHRFLEDAVGVRWYAPGVTQVPEDPDLGVPDMDRVVRPAFQWRHTSYAWPGKDDAFLARMGDNSGDAGPDGTWGVEHAHDGRAHSYFWYLSPDEFFDEHPEYFSEIGGVRIREETQLCLTNPDVLDIVTERMLRRMESKPGVRQHNFSQKDYYNYCQCDACSAMNAQYGTLGGTQFWFVNQLAERTAAVHPDKLIGTLAYMYTEEPPVGLEMHDNVAVWLCHMYPSCDSHPIDSCPVDADYKRRATAWSELSQHLYIWHYIVDFMHYYAPFPNFRAMASDMRFYRDIGVEGIYLQGMGHGGGGGEFSLLRPYYGMKLLWDPDQEPEAILRDFLQGYYGAAWRPIWDYIQLIHDKVEDDDIHIHLYTNPAMGFLPDALLDEAAALFDEAESLVADDEELLERVKVARMPLTYARFFPRNGYEIEGNRLVWQGEIASMPELRAFLDRMEAHGFQMVREVSGEPDTMLLLYVIIGSNQQVVSVENEHLRVEVVPMLAGRILRILHKASGEYVTAYNVKRSLFYPFGGGIEDRIGGIFRFFGWVEPGVVESRNDLSITTKLDTMNGWTLRRTVTLASDAPVLTIESTVTNPSESARELQQRSHMELDLGDVRTSRVSFTSRGGAVVDKDMADILAGLREGEHYYDEDTPDGEWSLSGSKGLSVTHRFDNDQVEFTWLYAYPEDLGELELEASMPAVVIEPGASQTFVQELEIHPTD